MRCLKYLIGVDVGTTGIKAGLFRTGGYMEASAFREMNLYCPSPDTVEQDPQEFYTGVCQCLREMLRSAHINPGDIAALSIDGQMAGIIGIDEDWNAVTKYDSWLDNRCKAYVDYITEHYCDQVLKICGLPPATAHCAKILWWKNEKKDEFKKIAKFIQPAAYVAGKLAGLKAKDAFIDYTYLHFSGLSDAQKAEWSDELIHAMDIPARLLPNIVPPWKIVGEISSKAARDCGLKEGTPIAAGAGDQAAGFLGAGIVRPGMVVDVAGTASLIACCVDEYKPDIKYKTLLFPRGAINNLWYPHSYIGGGGLCLRWFRDNLDKCKKEEKEVYYDTMNRAGERVPPGSDKLFFIPHLGGRNFPYDPKVRGAWAGFGWGHSKEHFYRSIMESIAYEYYYYMKIEKELFSNIGLSEVRVIGGGSKSRLFTSIKSNVLGLPYVRLDREEVAIWGSAMIAGKGVGLFSDLKETAESSVRTQEAVLPDPVLHEKYVKYAELYIDLFTIMDDFYTRLAGLPSMT